MAPVKVEASTSKGKSGDVQGIVSKMMELLSETDGPVSTSMLQSATNADPGEVIVAIQSALDDATIVISKYEGTNELCVQLATAKDKESQKKIKGLDSDERLVYQNIEAAGTAGIWVRDIRFNTNLPHPRVTKVLKSLETRKFIKTVKLHSQASKKIYILYELTPSEELTGGRWYTDGNLDEALVDTLRVLCVKMLEAHGELGLEQITEVVREKLSNQVLTEGNLKQILQTLVYDGMIDEQEEDGNSVYVNLIMRLPSTSPLSSVPCGQCPVIGECAEGNDVSPSTCQYMTAWLEF